MAQFGFDEEEEDVLASRDPQVTSQDPDERKAARWLRIKRRQDAIKRADAPSEEQIADEVPGLIEQATATAAEELQRMSLDGAAKVTNVKVTTDEREVIRRNLFSDRQLISRPHGHFYTSKSTSASQEETTAEKKRRKKLNRSMEIIEEEALDAQAQYEIITANWDVMLAVKDPLDIDAAMKAQRQACDALLAQKNKLISKLKSDLKSTDQAYYDDLEKQDNDIKELSERIEKQVTVMNRAYLKQQSLITEAIEIEREALVDHNNKRWEALYKQRDREEVAHMEYKEEKLEEHKVEIEAIMWDHYEKFREAKIELETLTQELQRELEKLKAVLKKREEENVFVRSQQKRKLNKMSDVANMLRSKIRKAAEDGAIEEIKADKEIVALMQAMDDLERKSGHFSHVNNYKFSQVWRMSAARCAELAKQLRQAEVALHAHILAEPPPPPPPPPPKSPLAKYEREEKQSNQCKEVELKAKESIDPRNMVAKTAKDKLVRHILQLVADNTGFLVEDRLLKLIEKYQLTARNLCTLDSIFMALEIQAEEDVELLCKIFLNYAFCPICVGMDIASESSEPATTGEASQEDDRVSHHASTATKSVRGDRSSVRVRGSVARSVSASTSRSVHVGFRGHELSPADQLMMAEADEIIQKCGDVNVGTVGLRGLAEPGGSASTKRATRGVTVTSQLLFTTPKAANPFLCPMGHHLEIEPMQALTALGEFMSVFVPPEKKKLYGILDGVKPPTFSSPSRKLTTEDIEKYWEEWESFFPSEKHRFWDGILSGLKSYLPILQERERLHIEVCELRHRNAALRAIVKGAMPELPRMQPKYLLPYPVAFTSAKMDIQQETTTRLPPIQ